MKKLNLDELSKELEVIGQEETMKIKGGYDLNGGYLDEANIYAWSPIVYLPIQGYVPQIGDYPTGDGGGSWRPEYLPSFLQDYSRLGQGYCVFNTVAYLESMLGGPVYLTDAKNLFNAFSGKFSRDINYNSSGVTGVDSTHLKEFVDNYFNATKLNGVTEIFNFTSQGKYVIGAVKMNSGGVVTDHYVAITGINGTDDKGNYTYDAWDTTEDRLISVTTGQILASTLIGVNGLK